MSFSYRYLVILAGLVGLAHSVHAEVLSCGSPTTTHMMRQTPNYKRSVDTSATTSRPVNLCPQETQTEAWVDGLTTYVSTSRATYSSAVFQSRNVPAYGTWHSSANHWLIMNGVFSNLGRTFAQAVVLAPPSASACELTPLDCPDGYEFVPGKCNCKTLSPILIDTAGDGYQLTSAEQGVEFDLNDNGHASERIAWTQLDSDDAWLVLDRNGNGTIDSGAELFGSRTPAYADSDDPRAANGFEALLLAEGPTYGGGVADRVIDAKDAVYSRLRLWFDQNHNGKADAGELVPLDQAGVIALGTAYRESGRRDQYGNRFALVGRGLFRTPGGRITWRPVFDVFLTVWPPATTGLDDRKPWQLRD